MIFFYREGAGDVVTKLIPKTLRCQCCPTGLKLKSRCLTFILISIFIYVQIKYALKTPHQLEGEEAQFICREGAVPLPPTPPHIQRQWKNLAATSATDKEAPTRYF